MMKCFWGLLSAVAVTVSACARVGVGQHLADTDYLGSPKRIFVVNRLDSAFQDTMPTDFASAIVPAMARCNIIALVYRPDQLELDADAKLRALLGGFKPDAVLNINQTRRGLIDGEVRSGSYLVVMSDVARNHVIWKSTMGTGASSRLVASRTGVGASFADEMLRTMVSDNVIKTCPPFVPTL